MRIVIAAMLHETHTFIETKTRLADFFQSTNGMPVEGRDAIDSCRGMNLACAAFVDLAESTGAEVVMPLLANGYASGVVEREAFEYMAGKIVGAVSNGCDAVMLDLHGAMVVEGILDAESELLQRIRDVDNDVPIAVALDPHGNISPRTVELATVVTAYRTIPHVDYYETGERAGSTLLQAIEGKVDPFMFVHRIPLIASLEKMNHKVGSMKDVMDLVVKHEASTADILNVSWFGGYPFADVKELGMSVVVVADGKPEKARQIAKEILSLAWENRGEFVYVPEPVETSIARARELDGLVVIVDSGDNAAAGGNADDMAVLREAVAQGLTNMAVGPICDVDSVAAMIDAGLGSRVTIALGGKTVAPLLNYAGEPFTVSGTVSAVSDGRFTITGPMETGQNISLGRTAVLDTGTMEIVVSERPFDPYDLGCFTHIGIDPCSKRYMLIKSRMHFRAVFEPIADHIVLVTGKGTTPSDFRQVPYRNAMRPIIPLDESVGSTLDEI